MYIRVYIANFCAKFSCAKWNPHQSLRRFLREIYLTLVEIDVRRIAKVTATGIMYCWSENPWQTWQPLKYGAGLSPVFDLYAQTIYGADLWFANWPEDKDALIGDRSRHVIRYSPSFCAFMIRLATGRWPSGQQCHAKDWVEYLAENGFTKTVPHPAQGEPYSFGWPGPEKTPKANFYIGVLPNYGKYGLTVWTDGTPVASEDAGNPQVLCATYLDGRFQQINLPNTEEYGEVTWVQIVEGCSS